jgi:hypothetical protein
MVALVAGHLGEPLARVETVNRYADFGFFLNGVGDLLQRYKPLSARHAKFNYRDFRYVFPPSLVRSRQYPGEVVGPVDRVPLSFQADGSGPYA